MTPARYTQLNSAESATLTKEERLEGWHFCPEWDYLCTNMKDETGETCSCEPWSEDEINS